MLASLDEQKRLSRDEVHARRLIARRYDLPYGAVAAADRREWDRLD